MIALSIAALIVSLAVLVLCGITMVAAVGSIMWFLERVGADGVSGGNKSEEGKDK
jgi:hypothetical protein